LWRAALSYVRAAKLLETDVGSLPIVLTPPTDEHPILVYDRRAQGRILSFELELDSPHLVDPWPAAKRSRDR